MKPSQDHIPTCPVCNKPCYRRGHMSMMQINLEDDGPDQEATCCMHCSRIWIVENMVLRTPSSDEMKRWWPILRDTAIRFGENRIAAILSGIPLDLYLSLQDAIAKTKPKHFNG